MPTVKELELNKKYELCSFITLDGFTLDFIDLQTGSYDNSEVLFNEGYVVVLNVVRFMTEGYLLK